MLEGSRVIAGLETVVMFSDLGSKKIHWIPCVRENGGEKEDVHTRTRTHVHAHTHST